MRNDIFRSYGSVYRGINKVTGTEHAVKVVRIEGNSSELKKEASHMLECRTPFIVSCDGYIDKGDELWVRPRGANFLVEFPQRIFSFRVVVGFVFPLPVLTK